MCTFKCKCLTGLQIGENHISARLQTHSGWHPHYQAAVPTSWPDVPPHQDQVHTLGRGMCRSWGAKGLFRSTQDPSERKLMESCNQAHRLWNHTWFCPSPATQLPWCPWEVTNIPSVSASSSVTGEQQHLPWMVIRAAKSDNGCGVLSTVPGTQ